MTDPTAVISMIHEGVEQNSATRLFRGEPVLAWTLRRLERSVRLAHMIVICWEDQVADVEPICGGHGANVMVKGPRAPIASVEPGETAAAPALKISGTVDQWQPGNVAALTLVGFVGIS